MRGFFPGSVITSSRPTSHLLPQCGACGFAKGACSPKMPFSGKGRKGILLVGEFPTNDDDEASRHFTGENGAMLEEALADAGVNMRKDCWMTNAMICRPTAFKGLEKHVGFCRPTLLKTVRELDPQTIILLGQSAVSSYLPEIWKSAPGPIGRWAGWNIPNRTPNAWVCPTFHPSFVRHSKDAQVLRALFGKHIAQACSHEIRPWTEDPPNYEAQVEVLLDTNKAARRIRQMQERGGTLAFDYENTCLKPEYEGGEIVCASFCWEGKRTISFPWHGEAIKATGEILRADNCRFIAANMKHEDRWTRKFFGHGVRHWHFDTMLASHALDNRTEGICGLKFQAFVQLGAEAYDEHIQRFLKTHGDAKINKVKQEVDLRQLLLYCGIDTVLEYYLAQIQIKQLNDSTVSL